jgi:hypothetical protein
METSTKDDLSIETEGKLIQLFIYLLLLISMCKPQYPIHLFLFFVDVDVIGGLVLQQRVLAVVHAIEILFLIVVIVVARRAVVLQHMAAPTA